MIKNRKDIAKDIKRLLNCTDEKQRLSVWCEPENRYMDKYWKIQKDYDRFNEFMVTVLYARIREAHISAVDYFFLIKKGYEEGEHRSYMLYESFDFYLLMRLKRLLIPSMTIWHRGIN